MALTLTVSGITDREVTVTSRHTVSDGTLRLVLTRDSNFPDISTFRDTYDYYNESVANFFDTLVDGYFSGSSAPNANQETIFTEGARNPTIRANVTQTPPCRIKPSTNYYLHGMVSNPGFTQNQSATATFRTPATDNTAPTLTDIQVPADRITVTSGVVTLTLSEASKLYWLASKSSIKPSVANVIAGWDPDISATAVAKGSQSVAAAGSATVTVTGLAERTEYFIHLLAEDVSYNKNQSTVHTSPALLTGDNIAPILSNMVIKRLSQTEIEGSVESDEADGRLYIVAASLKPTPTAAEIKAGTYRAGKTATIKAANLPVTTVGKQAFTLTGLTPDVAYFLHFMQEDDHANQSDVLTSPQVPKLPEFQFSKPYSITPWAIANAEEKNALTALWFLRWSVAGIPAQAFDNDGCPVLAHRATDNDNRHHWIPFYDKSVRCHRGPLKNDRYNRYYWTQDGKDLQYNALSELVSDPKSPGYVVGVPAPAAALHVTASAPDDKDTTQLTRAYVYTYVSDWGEESGPSRPITRQGYESSEWTISEFKPGPNDGVKRRLSGINLYRTVVGKSSTAFYFVARLPLTTKTHIDTEPSNVVAQNRLLETLSWSPPPKELKGLIAHPGGFFVGFTGRTVHFSVPYQPHAWPANYQLAVLGNIQGLGVFGSSIAVITDSYPYVINGIRPEAMTLVMNETSEPGISGLGIVSMAYGILYPSPNGLILISPRGLVNVTAALLAKEDWQTRYQPAQLVAAKHENRYVAFYNAHHGFQFDPNDQRATLVDIDLSTATAGTARQDHLFADDSTDTLYLMNGCTMYEWNPVSGAPYRYTWESKEYDFPDPVNLGAARIVWEAPYTPPTAAQTQAWRDYNVQRMRAAPLNPLNFAAINAVKPVTVTSTVAQIKQPFAGSPLIPVPAEGDAWEHTPSVKFSLIANDKTVYSKVIPHTKPFRLPSGFKATRFKVRIESNVHVKSVKLAETGKELSAV